MSKPSPQSNHQETAWTRLGGLPWILLYLAAVTAAIFLAFSHWAYDDPFITYRYARNIALGQGMVYNPGERILSTTTPIFALLLAVFYPIWPDLPHLAVLIGALSLGLGGIFLWDLARTWKTPAAGWTGLLLYPTFPLLVNTLGSETPLYLAFCLGAFALHARRSYLWTAVFAALATLARPDGVLVPLLLGAAYLVQHRHLIPWKAVLIFVGLTLPWFVFAWVYFGSPLPVSLAAKQRQGAMLLSQSFAAGLFAIAQGYAALWHYWLEAFLAVLGLIYAGLRRRAWFLFFAWPLVYFAAFSALGVTRYFWYYAPLVPGLVAAAGLGIAFLYERSAALSSRSPGIARQASVVVMALVLTAALAQGRDLLQLRQQPDRRILIYRAAGEWLEANTPAEARVGVLEAGAIGFYAQRPMVDFAGLIQPEVAAQITPETTYADTAQWAVERYQPDYLALPEGTFADLEAGYIARSCRLVKDFSGVYYGFPSDLNIYACRS